MKRKEEDLWDIPYVNFAICLIMEKMSSTPICKLGIICVIYAKSKCVLDLCYVQLQSCFSFVWNHFSTHSNYIGFLNAGNIQESTNITKTMMTWRPVFVSPPFSGFHLIILFDLS